MVRPSRLVDWTCSRLLGGEKRCFDRGGQSSATSFGPAPGQGRGHDEIGDLQRREQLLVELADRIDAGADQHGDDQQGDGAKTQGEAGEAGQEVLRG